MKAYLLRILPEEEQTIGVFQVYEDEIKLFECKTMELPWKNNQRQISCIPTGEYDVVKHTSPKFGNTFHVLNVPDRSEILIHKGNYNRNTLGCILPGLGLADIDGDGLRDVTSSVKAMDKLLSILPDKFTLNIT